MPQVTFYKKKDCDTDHSYRTYSTNNNEMTNNDISNDIWPDSGSNNMGNDISSIKVGSSSWVELYDDVNCSSDHTISMGPGESLNCSNGFVKSFKLFNYDPNAATKLTCWQDDFSGRTQTFDEATSLDNLHDVKWDGDDNDHMNHDISAVQVNGQSSLYLYSGEEYQGRIAYLEPNAKVDLSELVVDGNNMNNASNSLQLFDGLPAVDVIKVINNFIALYPKSTKISQENFELPPTPGMPGQHMSPDKITIDSSDVPSTDFYCRDFYAGNGRYLVYYPQIYLNQINDDSTNTVTFKIHAQHIQDQIDDHAYVMFSMNLDQDENGEIIADFIDDLNIEYVMGGSVEVPDWVIKMADLAVDGADKALKLLVDAATETLTEGAGTPALSYINKGIDIAAKAVTFGIDHINAVLGFLFQLSDDGTQLYFPAVVSHTVPRMVKAFLQDVLGEEENSNETFDTDAFLSAFSADAWDNSRNTPCINFQITTNNFRCNMPDNSFAYNNDGLMSTVKIDAVTSNAKDDHLSLQTIFDKNGELFCLVGTVDIYQNRYPDDYVAPTSGIIFYDVDGNMQQITKSGEDDPVATLLTQYSSLESAYESLMRNAINDLESYDINITQQQRDLVTASLQAVDAIGLAIQG